MDFNIKVCEPEKLVVECLVVPVFTEGKMPDITIDLDKSAKSFISKILANGDLRGEIGDTMLLYSVPGISADKILLVGCGNQAELEPKKYCEIMQKLGPVLAKINAKTIGCCLAELALEQKHCDTSWKIQQGMVCITASNYKFTAFKSKSNTDKATTKKAAKVKTLYWVIASAREQTKAQRGLDIGNAINGSMQLVKDLANMPPNVCNPEYMAKAALSLGKEFKSLKVTVIERKELVSLGMGALLAVGQGSDSPPKLVTIEYYGGKKDQQPLVLVGKGITFDTGGNSLKQPPNMIGMKYDMCGAATVMGMMRLVAALGLKINVVGVAAIAENMPGASASRPDDIITTMSGLTVEILNTDAEGRLILGDALTYCERFNPSYVINIATLTGACVAALGAFHSGLMSNHQELADKLLAAGLVSGDKCWQLPLTEEYAKLLDSNVADMANIGGAEGGAIIAGCFLSKFTQKYRWAHLDVAGTACRYTGKDRAATGQPIPLLTEFILNHL